MSKSLLSLLILVLVFAGSYFWYVAQAVCPIPISYRIDQFDEEFGITESEVRAAISDAESLWEDATGLNLFTHDAEEGEMPISFIFDERQQFTDAEEELSEKLDEAKAVNEAIEAEYAKLVEEYASVSNQYEGQVAAYERRLFLYNQEVDDWNSKGGAPTSVYESLNEKKLDLDKEKKALDQTRLRLNTLADTINAVTEKANNKVAKYNESVETYNSAFSEATEFTQGFYQAGKINIYQFGNHEELVLVMAHELGHALGVGHVDNEESIMFMRMEGQTTLSGLTSEDMEGFVAACGDGSVWSRLTAITFW